MSKARGLADLGNVYNDGALSNRNKILNGSMVLDQRNSGAEVSPAPSGYGLDRWATYKSGVGTFKLQQSTDAPAGFKNSALLTVTSASTPSGDTYYILLQNIEGNNIVDLSFGSASAKAVTLSFWVKSSVTGTFGASLRNGATDRSYPFTYSVSSAGVWEQKSVSVVGDTSGTWLTTNGTGISLTFSLGASGTILGTAGAWASTNALGVTGQTNWIATAAATFQITGVQLEVGDTATPFEHRSYGDELQRCKRFFQLGSGLTGVASSTTSINSHYQLHPTMRTTPTVSKLLGDMFWGDMVSYGVSSSATPLRTTYLYSDAFVALQLSGFTALTAYRTYRNEPQGVANGRITFDAEL